MLRQGDGKNQVGGAVVLLNDGECNSIRAGLQPISWERNHLTLSVFSVLYEDPGSDDWVPSEDPWVVMGVK